MKIDIKITRKILAQIGVLVVAGGVLQGVFLGGSQIPIAAMVMGVILMVVASLRIKS